MIVVTAASGSAGIGFWQWVGAGLALAVGAALATIARWLIRRHDVRRATVTSSVQILARLVFIIVLTAGLYVALRIIGVDLGPVLGGAGIAGIALAFALKDIAENYISGILLGLRNPFTAGHQIVSGSYEGTVEELNLRYTTIRTPDGVRVLLPNAGVLKSPLTNLTVNGHRRSDFAFAVAYGTDLEQARQVALEALRAVDGVVEDPAPEAWVEELAASWVALRLRFSHGPRDADVWRVRSAAIIGVVDAMGSHGIVVPFERTVVELERD